MGLAFVLEIVGEVDGGHAASTEFPLDGVTLGEGGFEALRNVCHVTRRCDFADGRARLAAGVLLSRLPCGWQYLERNPSSKPSHSEQEVLTMSRRSNLVHVSLIAGLIVAGCSDDTLLEPVQTST